LIFDETGYGILAGFTMKRRKVVCGHDREGRGGCGQNWFTYEIPAPVLGDASSSADSGPGRKRGRKKKGE